MNIDKPTPRAEEAERALLGGVLTDSGRLVELRELIDPSDFWRREHAVLYIALLSMLDQGIPIDLVSVTQQLGPSGWQHVGGAGYIAELPEHCPSTANLAHYAEQVRLASVRRQLARLAVDLANAAYDGSEDPFELASAYAALLLELEAKGPGSQPVRLREGVTEAEQHRQDVIDRAVPAPVTTGFRGISYSLDRHLGGGLRAGSVVVVAGATSMGKTGLAVAFASKAARSGRPGLYVTLEMPVRDIVNRIRSERTGVPLTVIEGERDDASELALEALTHPLDDLWVWYRPGVSFAEVRAQARRMWARGELAWMALDYLQIMRHPLERGETRASAIGQTMVGLKTLAGELEIPIVVLSQLNREFDRRQPPRGSAPAVTWTDLVQLPQLSDLAESGAIEHAADVVLFPANADRYGIASGPLTTGGGGVVVIGKNRNGPRTMVPSVWDGPCACYRPLGTAP